MSVVYFEQNENISKFKRNVYLNTPEQFVDIDIAISCML